MSQQAKRLTKSRFKLGAGCPSKLYFNDRKEYANRNHDDEFLKALADGGFQVGELAKLYYPGGHSIETLDYEEALSQTSELLKQENVIIYEAALGFENLFVRVDILVKKGNSLKLVEVKAKSFDSEEGIKTFKVNPLKKGIYELHGDYKDYLLDLSFQTFVAQKAKPQFRVFPYLMLADKSKKATTDGLNQKFLIKRGEEGRTRVQVSSQKFDLGAPLLTEIELSEVVEKIIDDGKMDFAENFESLVNYLSQGMKNGKRLTTGVSADCKKCEFRVSEEKLKPGQKSGFRECWSEEVGFKDQDFKKDLVFDVWNFRSAKAIEGEKYFASDLVDSDFSCKGREDGKSGLSTSERQVLQVNFVKKVEKGPFYFDHEGLKEELDNFHFPIHFIDFETTMVAIPFHKGRRPYEQMAFQFSHHVLHQNGKLEHRTEYLDDRRGVFPNFDFARALKKALDGDNGTVLRFAAHENTVLNQIRGQLKESNETDKVELIQWIESLTSPPKESKEVWNPIRQFVDMCELTKRFYFLPETKGSNSIKKVLPAVLNVCRPEVQAKFPDWIKTDEHGRMIDPYKLLPPVFDDIDQEDIEKFEETLSENEDLNNGGAAMMAWARMQFSEMSDQERKSLREALLRYCKLDTLAMVMIFEWWMDEIKNGNSRKKAA